MVKSHSDPEVGSLNTELYCKVAAVLEYEWCRDPIADGAEPWGA